ncbi:MAG: superoxide dismutase [Mariprofundales bacterium]
MAFELPRLPYAQEALEPHISAETLSYHHGKHHRAYVTNLNALVAGTAQEEASLEQLIRTASGGVFNNAAQAWNHAFYWQCLSPNGGGTPQGVIADAIAAAFGSFEEFRKQFAATAMTTFGSGWAWLVRSNDGTLALRSTSNAGNPITDGDIPLLTCDVWEHAYYIDYRNGRADYVEAFWQMVNWDFVTKNFSDE